jgi:hypothetical protein
VDFIFIGIAAMLGKDLIFRYTDILIFWRGKRKNQAYFALFCRPLSRHFQEHYGYGSAVHRNTYRPVTGFTGL